MYVVYGLILFFSAVGIVQIMAWIKYLLLKPEQKVTAYLMLPVSGHVENIEQLLRYYCHRLEWDLPSAGVEKLVIVDEGMDDSTSEICRKFCLENTAICFCRFK